MSRHHWLAVACLALLASCKSPLHSAQAGEAPAAQASAQPASTAGVPLDLSPLGERRADQIDGPALEVHFIDVGQGDGVLIRSVEGKHVLIDTGPPEAKRTLLGYLAGLGIDTIDLLVNTHPHADHIGNTSALIEQLEVKRVLDSGYPHPTATVEKMLATIERESVPLRIVRRGQRIKLGDATLVALGPEDPLIEKSRSQANANSIVLRLDFGDVRFLLTGDAEHETEERLLKQRASSLRSTVLKVAHHGSAHASAKAFLDVVQPDLAIISCAKDNKYGHPDPGAVERLRAVGAAVLSTADLGHIVVRTDGQKIAVSHGHALPASAAGQGDRLDLNAATRAELEALPGIGAVLAARIVEWRTRNGRFERIEDLDRVEGIGESRIDDLRPLVTVKPR